MDIIFNLNKEGSVKDCRFDFRKTHDLLKSWFKHLKFEEFKSKYKISFSSFFLFALLMPQIGWSQMNIVRLGVASFSNNKTFIVEEPIGHKKPIRLEVLGKNVGEPAMSPIEVSAFITCDKKKTKPIDLARILLNTYGDRISHMLGKPSKKFPLGVVKVCSLESVNMDGEKIIIGILVGDTHGCNQKETTEFVLPIQDYCKR